MSALSTMPDSDPAQFLKIASQGAGLSSHADLWHWLQGDVQQWLAHDAMLIGWGDFASGDLQFDIISSLPGMRSQNWTVAKLSPLLRHLHACWTAAHGQPCQLDFATCSDILRRSGGGWPPIDAIVKLRTALVHGLSDAQHGRARIFAALTRTPEPSSGAGTALKLLVPFIDSALQRIPPAPVRSSGGQQHDASGRKVIQLPALSERERQIMEWVAMGKTNPEIGCILNISEFTVKNHMKSIFGKLDVTNRAQAVSTLTRMVAYG